MDEARLIEKLRLVEALFAGAATEGERVAAEHARKRILERLRRWEQEDPPLEYRFPMADVWSRKVFVALLRRYEIRPYRYRRQRYTTVMARVPKRFVEETLWPEFEQISETLHTYLSGVTDRVVHQVIHGDSSEAEVVDEPRQLPMTLEPTGPGSRDEHPPRAGSRSKGTGPTRSERAGSRSKRPEKRK